MKKLYIYILLFSLFSASYAQNYPTGEKEIKDMKNHPLYRDLKSAKISFPQKSTGKNQSTVSFIDNSKHKYFPAVIYQKGGSCSFASGIGYIYNYEYNLANDLDSSLPENIYNYLQVYSFLNEGIDSGGFTIKGWMLVKENGVPAVSSVEISNIFDWYTGYDRYYKGMKRGVESTATIYSDDEGAIERMKQYLIDHGDGSEYGGLIKFSAYSNPMDIFKYNGPRSTDYDAIIPYFGHTGMHSMTVVGFDDSIEYDYNEDGVIQDYEQGAFICVNTWGENWDGYYGCNSHGRFYTPYYAFSTLKQSKKYVPHTPENMGGGTGNGGKGCLVLKTKNNEVDMTLKIKIRHTSRNDFMMEVGVASTNDALYPEKTVVRRFMNHQGGEFTMRGIRGTRYETLEFGLNISDMLQYVSGPDATFFLNISNIPCLNKGEGELLSCSLLDYRYDKDNPVEYIAEIDKPVLANTTVCRAVIRTKAPDIMDGDDLSVDYTVDSFNKKMCIYLNSLNSVDIHIDLLSHNAILIKEIASKTIPAGVSSEIFEFGDLKAGTYWLRFVVGSKYLYKKLILR